MTQTWVESIAETDGRDRYEGFLITTAHPLADAFPKVNPVKDQFERRFEVPFDSGSLGTAIVLDVYTEALKKAGTVDDVDRIIETLETETFDTLLGPVFFGMFVTS